MERPTTPERSVKPLLIVLMVVISVAGAVYFDLPGRVSYAVTKGQIDAHKDTLALERVEEFSQAFRHVAAIVKPSVVYIEVARTDPTVEALRRKFGLPGQGFRTGIGSGVIVSKEGHILTNHHVIEGAMKQKVQVTLPDGRRPFATVVGTDPQTDLAVIKINVGSLHPIELGNSDSVEVGDWVLAVGAPFGLRQSVTAGIISARNRQTHVLGAGGYEDFLQTDAAINPGNSGGPLVDMHGRLIGINDHITTASGGSQGVGMAIPVNMAKFVMKRLIADKRVVRGYLGVTIQNLDQEGLAESFGYMEKHGVLVIRPLKGSPAEKAGLKAQDIIMALDGKKVENVRELRGRVAMIRPGTKVSLTVWRDGKKLTLSLVTGELPAERLASGMAPTDRTGQFLKTLGLITKELTPERAKKLGAEEVNGVYVEEVLPNSPAHVAHIEPGWIIVEVHKTPVRSPRQLEDAIRKHVKQGGVRLQLYIPSLRGGGGYNFKYLRIPKDQK